MSSTVIGPRGIYIVPTRYGLLFAVALILMLLISINYNNGLGHLFTFVAAGIGVVAMYYTQRNLLNLEVSLKPGRPVFAGEDAELSLSVADRHRRARNSLWVRCAGNEVEFDVDAEGERHLPLAYQTSQRGVVPLPRCGLVSIYPLGLFCAWTRTLESDGEQLVYPRPAPRLPFPDSEGGDERMESRLSHRGEQDFHSIREHQPTDPISRIHWKHSARGEGLKTKQFAGQVGEMLSLRWQDTPSRDDETRLEILCRWVLDAEAGGRRYSLSLPGVTIESGRGTEHQRRCLTALARWARNIMKLPKIPAPPPHEPGKSALQTLFASAVFAVALHMSRLPLWISALFVCFVLWRTVLLRINKPVPGKWIRLVLTMVTLAAILFQYQTVFGRSAGSALLIAFSGLKILETSDLRDAMFSNMLILIIVLSALLFDQSPYIAVCAFAALIVVVANFNTLISPQGFSWRRAVRLTGIILLNGVPLAVAVYILFPRIDGSLWGIANDPHSAVTGMADTISPGDVNRLSRSDKVAFRVEFDGVPPPVSELYWRVKVLDHFDGRVWRKMSKTWQRSTVLESPRSQSVDYAIILEPTEKEWLPLLETSTDLDNTGYINARGVGTSRRKIHQRTEYRASSILGASRMMSFASSDAATNFRIHPEVQSLATSLANGETSSEAIVRRTLDMFREEAFYYTLEPPIMGARPGCPVPARRKTGILRTLCQRLCRLDARSGDSGPGRDRLPGRRMERERWLLPCASV